MTDTTTYDGGIVGIEGPGIVENHLSRKHGVMLVLELELG